MKTEAWKGKVTSVKHSGSSFLKWTSATGTGATSLPFIDDVTVDGRSMVDGESLWIYTPISQREQS